MRISRIADLYEMSSKINLAIKKTNTFTQKAEYDGIIMFFL